MKKIVLMFALLGCMPSHSLRAAEQTLTSPDGNYTFRVYDRAGSVFYTVDYNGRQIILESRLGIGTGDADSGSTDKADISGAWDGTLELGETSTRTEQDETWQPLYGERASIRDNYRQLTVDLVRPEHPRARLKLIVRAYDEGVAFRYAFPGVEYLNITREHTTFHMPEGTKAWFTPRAQQRYALLPLSDWPGKSERPLVCVLPDGMNVLLTEAAVVDYVRTKFTISTETPNTLACAMYGPADVTAPYETPWRVVMAAARPGELIENNDLILNLNPPSEIENPWWITPGKAMREVTLSTQGALDVVDFCVEHNLQYIMFDAGWYGPERSSTADATVVSLDPDRNGNPRNLDLPAVIAYARARNIKVILYVNQRALEKQLDEILPLYRKWGVSGIKFGFVQVGSHHWTTWLHEAVKKCAEYGLVVDIHDEYRPSGFSRTYPNLLSQEGIYGNEEFPDATTNATLPFTRFTQGPADYTICYYRRDWSGNSRPDTSHGLVNARFVQNTPAHQLALAAIYYSPYQMLYWYDKPSDYRGEPELAFWDAIPTVWDDTKVVQGEIGQYITVARRSGEQWFVGTITGNEGRKLSIPLDFLEPGREYTATVYADDPKVKTRTQVGIRTVKVTSRTVLDTPLLPSGGQAIRITPNE